MAAFYLKIVFMQSGPSWYSLKLLPTLPCWKWFKNVIKDCQKEEEEKEEAAEEEEEKEEDSC